MGASAATPSTEAQAGQPADTTSGSEPDAFAFADGGAAQAQAPATDGQGSQPQEEPPAPGSQPAQTPPTVGKSYLKDEFGGDVTKLDKAYGELRPFATKLAQSNRALEGSLQEARNALEFLEQTIGPEIENLLVQKGLINNQGQPGQQPADDPDTRPLTMRDLRSMQEKQERFNNMVNGFKANNPQWEQFKPQIAEILTKYPHVGAAIVQGQMPMDTLVTMARGMVFDAKLKEARDSGLKEGMMGHNARVQGAVEGSSMGAAAGKDDAWGFAG